MTLVYAKKALTLKKSTKSTPAHQKKSEPQKKSTKKHYSAFKSSHYDPCKEEILNYMQYEASMTVYVRRTANQKKKKKITKMAII